MQSAQSNNWLMDTSSVGGNKTDQEMSMVLEETAGDEPMNVDQPSMETRIGLRDKWNQTNIASCSLPTPSSHGPPKVVLNWQPMFPTSSNPPGNLTQTTNTSTTPVITPFQWQNLPLNSNQPSTQPTQNTTSNIYDCSTKPKRFMPHPVPHCP